MLLKESTMRELAPSIFSNTHEGSERYAHVPTYEIVKELETEGYFPTSIMQHNPRKKSQEHTTHLVRLRHRDFIGFGKTGGNDEVPEILIMNSHNRERALSIMGGVFRFACANGLIMGDSYSSLTARHIGDLKKVALDFAHELPDRMKVARETFDRWKTITMSDDMADEFARRAAIARFNYKEDADFDFRHLLTNRRAEDQGRDLYRLFNVVQENTVKGGRSIKQAKRLVDYNKTLWNIADEFAGVPLIEAKDVLIEA